MDKATFVQPICTAILTALLTFSLNQWQTKRQIERIDRSQFISEAQAAAQDATRLLNDGYNELTKLVDATGDLGWQEFSASSWRDYMTFHRKWRQQIIAEHFKLLRYFGRDVADQLIHADEIDLHPMNNLASPDPCTPPGGKDDFDIVKLAEQTECTTRMITLGQDMIRNADKDEWSRHEFFNFIGHKKEQEAFAGKLLEQYDRASVNFLRVLDDRLSQLGEPQVKLTAPRKS